MTDIDEHIGLDEEARAEGDPSDGAPGDVALRIHPDRVLKAMLLVDAALIVLHIGASVLRRNPIGPTERIEYSWDLLGVNQEASVPTWWSIVALAGLALATAATAFAARAVGDPRWTRWAALAAVAAYLGLDESAMIHERFMDPVQDALDIDGGLLFYAWVIPAGAIVVVFLAWNYRFWRDLPARPRIGIAAGAALFVLGAIGVEMIGGLKEAAGEEADLSFDLLVALEEGFEMVGVALAVWSVLLCLSATLAGRHLRVGVTGS